MVKKIVILGSTGMLGNAVSRLFVSDKNFQTFTSYRNKNLVINSDSFYFDALRTDVREIPDCDYVLNCIGTIKPFMEQNPTSSILINSVFPRRLADWCQGSGKRLIHITTDCVFSGKTGQYNEESLHDCLDDYGKSKSLGEPKNCMTIRTSIIGEEIHKNASLIEWIKSMNGKSVKGFTNHLWNGVTTSEYADICRQIIEKDLYCEDLFHVFSNSVNKYQLVSMICDSLSLDVEIQPYETDSSCDRTLSTTKDLMSKIKVRSIEEQILLLRK